MKAPKTIALCLLVFTLSVSQARAFGHPTYLTGQIVQIPGQSFYRTELYFGRSKPGGGMVTDDEWEKFVVDVVTPRFPDGFTILKGIGQYREKSGKIISEPSQVLIFLYPPNKRTSSRRKIEEIRRSYVKQFSQESVLRMDFARAVRVLF